MVAFVKLSIVSWPISLICCAIKFSRNKVEIWAKYISLRTPLIVLLSSFSMTERIKELLKFIISLRKFASTKDYITVRTICSLISFSEYWSNCSFNLFFLRFALLWSCLALEVIAALSATEWKNSLLLLLREFV